MTQSNNSHAGHHKHTKTGGVVPNVCANSSVLEVKSQTKKTKQGILADGLLKKNSFHLLLAIF